MSYNASIPIPPRAMWPARLPPHPPRVLFYYDSHLKKHIVWTQELDSIEGTCSTPTAHDATQAISSDPRCRRHKPSASMARWAFSRPVDRHFVLVTHLTVSNYGDIRMQDIVAMLNSMRQLEELELCRVNILEANGLLVLPPGMVRSLRRLAVEACNITQGLSDAHYDLLFRFLSLFERIERLRLVATIPGDRREQLHLSPGLASLSLPTVAHLEAEGFSSLVLIAFFQQRYPVRELHSLHLSRCFSSWRHIDRLARIVRRVSPTLRHLAFRPNLEAQQPTRGPAVRLFRTFTDAVSQCAELREVEFGLYAPSQLSISLFQAVLAVVRIGRLRHLAFVLDLGWHSQLLSDPDIVPWSELDEELDRVCVEYRAEPLEIRIQRCPTSNMNLNVNAGYFEDPDFWVQRLPDMHDRVRVVDTVRAEPPAIGHYAAPARIDEQRTERISTSRLRSLFDL